MAEHEQSGPPSGGAHPEESATWERDVLRDLAFSALREQRRARRWRILYRALIAALVVVALVTLVPSEVPIGPHTALVRLDGAILEETHASAENINDALRAAFQNKGARGVLLQANSPGGSPVQAGYIYDEIVRLRERHPDKPLYAVIGDVCASACYYIASAADKVYANRASLVGSIGVLYDGFGYAKLINKLGIERRLLTAGENKGMMDPFSPLDREEVAHFQAMLDEIHQQFIEAVKRGRGERLIEGADLFSGLIWTGARGVELGLVDELASPAAVAREVIGQEDVVDYTPSKGVLERLAGVLGASFGRALVPRRGLR
ncbi:MAG: S49 family peptidase [Gammaproteobacteria bacterium]|nr:S49 family peptidase [Gammaproteobacteria bacterium]NIR96685.1 S49 family peptidase [Gammaproteobacteria bacterium]NIT62389.1 S49 family peptidase [Gammaproteobacteria bacterium]NIV19321.1 S49 family peptidase [Gammaproteobacteria bacterium]NIX10282.1 S49 family peptidase [Gammaproteobacteria bacterium]